MKVQFDEWSEGYAILANDLRRRWEQVKAKLADEEPVPSTIQGVAELMGMSDTLECIQALRLFNNLRWAIEKDNKYLLNEAADGFPIMNYVLNEGPYMPPSDAVFGAEDRHIILEGDHKNLIYFQTQIDGLEKGRYVEYLG